MRWTPASILSELVRRHERGESIALRHLARANRDLVSAAAYHFGSFRSAVERAGIDYPSVSRRPTWTKTRLIQLIKQARRDGEDLSWTSVMAGDGALRRAAFVAVQKRMFGGWPRALQAAGVDADESRRYLDWDKTAVASELKQRHADRHPMNSAALRKGDPALHAAAIRYFSSYRRAMKVAGLEVGLNGKRKSRRQD